MATKVYILAVALAGLGLARFTEATLSEARAALFRRESLRHSAALADIARNMSVQSAFRVLQDHPRSSPSLVSLVQERLSKVVTSGTARSRRLRQRHGSEGREAPAEEGESDKKSILDAGLIQAKDMLNGMIYEVQEQYEIEHKKCCDYESNKREMIEEVAQDIALFNAQSAQARERILSAQSQISIAENRVPKLRESLAEHNRKCESSIEALRHEIELLSNDKDVMTALSNVTECKKDPSLFLCPIGCAGGAGGEEVTAAFFGHAGLRSAADRLRSPVVKQLLDKSLKQVHSAGAAARSAVAVRRTSAHARGAGREPTKRRSTTGSHAIRAHAAGRRSSRRLPASFLQAQQQAFQRGAAAEPNGTAPRFIRGGPCELPVAADKRSSKCVLEEASCETLQARLLTVHMAMLDKYRALEAELHKAESTCKEVKESLDNQISDFTTQLLSEQGKLASATKDQNTADEQNRLKTVEKTNMEKEFAAMTATCHKNYQAFEDQECGLKKIRGELFKMKAPDAGIVFQDCELSGWTATDCSATCDGGTQTLTRTIVANPDGGVKCLPLARKQPCNEQRCPIDCKLGDWESWSGCTAECGGGVMQRSRLLDVKPKGGGRPCGETSEVRSCNVQSCNEDCALSAWTAWSGCSKACGGGRQRRIKFVEKTARGTGTCPTEKSDDRLQYMECNTKACPSNLACLSALDVVLLLDGSSGIGAAGWEATKQAAESLLRALGTSGQVKASVILFSGPDTLRNLERCTNEDPTAAPPNVELDCKIKVVSRLTDDVKNLALSMKRLEWPQGSALTSLALGLAEGELSLGRKDANSVVVVISEGKPLSVDLTTLMAHRLRKKARVIWVPVIGYSALDNIRKWTSDPDEENIVPVKDFTSLAAAATTDQLISLMCPSVTPQTYLSVPPPTFTPAMSYISLNAALDADFTGRGVCGEGRHVCNYQEVTVMSIGFGYDAPAGAAWIVGGFSNWEPHRRSIWNGQDSTQCQAGNFPAWWEKWGPYYGRVHCHPEAENRPVACCANMPARDEPESMRLSTWRGQRGDYNGMLDGDYNGAKACGEAFHICNFQEVTMYGAVKGASPKGWIVGGFSNLEGNRRSIWNGEDTEQCEAGSFPFLNPQFGPYYARVGCTGGTEEMPAVCCRNRKATKQPLIIKLNGNAVQYPTLASQLDSDWEGKSTCGADWHVCNYQEVTVYMSVSGVDVGQEAWIVGGYSNLEFQRRSIWNGQDSVQCKEGHYPYVYPKWMEYYGLVHCGPEGDSRQVLCCRDDSYKYLHI